jgi:hypothetical protein
MDIRDSDRANVGLYCFFKPTIGLAMVIDDKEETASSKKTMVRYIVHGLQC